MNSVGTRFSWNVFEAVRKTRSTCFIGSKTIRVRLVVLRVAVKRDASKGPHNIRNNDLRHLIPKVCSGVLKNGAEILTESIVK